VPPVIVVEQFAERADATVKMDGPPAHMPLPDDEADGQPDAEPGLDTAGQADADADDADADTDTGFRTPLAKAPQKRASQANYIKLRPYEPPPIDLFDFAEHPQHDLDRKAMLDLAQRLEATLADYTVKGRVAAIHPGPVVTMYEFVPAPGAEPRSTLDNQRIGSANVDLGTIHLPTLTLGVLQVLNKKAGLFDDRDRDLLCELAGEVATALSETALHERVTGQAPERYHRIVGSSPSMRRVYEIIARAAAIEWTRITSCASCRDIPAATARTMSDSVAMNGNSSSIRCRTF